MESPPDLSWLLQPHVRRESSKRVLITRILFLPLFLFSRGRRERESESSKRLLITRACSFGLSITPPIDRATASFLFFGEQTHKHASVCLSDGQNRAECNAPWRRDRKGETQRRPRTNRPHARPHALGSPRTTCHIVHTHTRANKGRGTRQGNTRLCFSILPEGKGTCA